MGNRILSALPYEEFACLLPHLEQVNLEKGEIVYLTGDNIEHTYFPENGLLSLLFTTETGSTVEIASVGSEGVVGLPVILGNHMIPYDVTVQFTTEACKIRAKQLQEEFDKGEALNEFVLRYLSVLIAQISQSSLCNRFHTLDQALSRWLLTVRDRINSDNLNITHETISHSLGVPRTAVTAAAGELQREGIIRYMRGKISILDRARLEEKSCECYRNICDQLCQFPNDEFPGAVTDQAASGFRHSPVLDRHHR
jgi:CRP-like cAMP-binding protein